MTLENIDVNLYLALRIVRLNEQIALIHEKLKEDIHPNRKKDLMGERLLLIGRKREANKLLNIVCVGNIKDEGKALWRRKNESQRQT